GQGSGVRGQKKFSRLAPHPSPLTPWGDIFISVDQARKQAKALGHSLLKEILTLAIHGILHLLGYRDHTPRDRRRMFHKQDQLLNDLGRALRARPY
ncbi:MAG: rRNA maturation RNase YbeY, partial [Elusimicrobia bacterium]|nr:rRNA maturation RNase YbeY [Elusimicrobiota bacterium]